MSSLNPRAFRWNASGRRARAVGITLGIALASLALPAAAEPPPVVAASGPRMPGKLLYAELATPNLDAAKAFYGALLGWTFRDATNPRGRAVVALVHDQPVASLIERSHPPRHGSPAWLPVLSVADPADAVAKAKYWGGRVILPPAAVAESGLTPGEETILADPQGAPFAAFRARTGDAPDDDTPPAQGEWIWSALLTRDPFTAAGFYQQVFGYQVQAAPDATKDTAYLLLSQSVARGTVNPLPARVPPSARGRWVAFVQVDGVGASAEAVERLGGKVLVQPHPDRRNVMIAIVSDPAGTVFGLMEWHGADPASAEQTENAK
ncbi:VOC family protein [Gluconacetobacter sp. Hr-1-5]|uniref:VOC family protein n=1 Tax=Gluconacetobacter sp. Hr-1-5 TaxID=3395370 RepID=UPI003B519320